MKNQFRKIRLGKANKHRLKMINSIIKEYSDQGYKLTLRQLYYQLVSRDVIPNEQKEYAKLSILLREGRMGGVVDWNAIEDRLRVPKIPYYVSSIQNAINDTISQYRIDRQSDQDNYVEVWVEKDALSGVLYPITNKYHVRLMVNRGYSSVSAMYDAYCRFSSAINKGQNVIVLYLGDHDPSGLDMIRDIEERTYEFLNKHFEYPQEVFEIVPIGLTIDQIKKYDPPPNPAKLSDTRACKYIEQFGRLSWEVDALNPKVLNELLKEHIEKRIDLNQYKNFISIENDQKNEIENMFVISKYYYIAAFNIFGSDDVAEDWLESNYSLLDGNSSDTIEAQHDILKFLQNEEN